MRPGLAARRASLLMDQAFTLAGQVLRLEQRLEAYQKLHSDELLELRRSVDECKRAIATLCNEKTGTPLGSSEAASPGAPPQSTENTHGVGATAGLETE